MAADQTPDPGWTDAPVVEGDDEEEEEEEQSDEGGDSDVQPDPARS